MNKRRKLGRRFLSKVLPLMVPPGGDELNNMSAKHMGKSNVLIHLPPFSKGGWKKT